MRDSRGIHMGGFGLTSMLVAAAAFGAGYYIASRRDGAASGGMGGWTGRRGGRRRDDRDRHHRHVSDSHPEAMAGTSPDPGELIGERLGRKSARDSAAVLYDQDGNPIRASRGAYGESPSYGRR